ncbi:MAG: hypothetical protein KIT84_17895 [Labilithrix sp.]|nr:hypothetical protein [Labilithrix sp.]MCW5812905.1 hypothetical protein [Labilithrix sp.]
MGRFADLETCAELTLEHAREAAASLVSMRAFLDWASFTARPEEGAPKVLLAIAQLAQASWIDGALYVDVTGDDAVTKISIFADYGFGIRERLLPLARLDAPFDEFVRAVRLSPKLIAPFRGETLAGSLILTPPDAELGEEKDLADIAIAESSLLDDPNRTVPPPPAAAVTKPPPSVPEQSGVHTHPTVRRMVAVRPEALRSGNDD